MKEAEFVEIEVSVDSDEKAKILADILADIQYPTAQQLQRMVDEIKREFAERSAKEFLGEIDLTQSNDSPKSYSDDNLS